MILLNDKLMLHGNFKPEELNVNYLESNGTSIYTFSLRKCDSIPITQRRKTRDSILKGKCTMLDIGVRNFISSIPSASRGFHVLRLQFREAASQPRSKRNP